MRSKTPNTNEYKGSKGICRSSNCIWGIYMEWSHIGGIGGVVLIAEYPGKGVGAVAHMQRGP